MHQAKAVPYAWRIGVKASNAVQLVEAVQRGLPNRAFERLQRAMGVNTREVADLVVIPARTLARRKVEGRLQPDKSERLLRASRIYDSAVNLFERYEAEALAWMRAPASARWRT